MLTLLTDSVMVHPVHRKMTARLLRQIASKQFPPAEEVRLSTARYTERSWYERELRQLFRKRPLVVAHSSEVPAVGSCLTVDEAGIGAILVRAKDGRVRAFLNACRHRGTRLVDKRKCHLTGVVCPYHKWSYDLTGQLTGLPHRKSFSSLEAARRRLVELPVAERHGLIWLLADPHATLALDAYLGNIDEELSALGLGEHVLYQQFESEHAANWKLVVDAFLEAYHIRGLHKDTLARFFCDSQTAVDQVGPHLRAVTGRRRIVEGLDLPAELWPVREMVTPSYVIFPNTVLIAHPDFISVVTLFPLAPGKLKWVHRMLIPTAPADDAAKRHWERSAQLIEKTVFQDEDIRVAELIQRGLQTGADEELVFGQLEFAVPWFHRTLEAAMAADG